MTDTLHGLTNTSRTHITKSAHGYNVRALVPMLTKLPIRGFDLVFEDGSGAIPVHELQGACRHGVGTD